MVLPYIHVGHFLLDLCLMFSLVQRNIKIHDVENVFSLLKARHFLFFNAVSPHFSVLQDGS